MHPVIDDQPFPYSGIGNGARTGPNSKSAAAPLEPTPKMIAAGAAVCGSEIVAASTWIAMVRVAPRVGDRLSTANNLRLLPRVPTPEMIAIGKLVSISECFALAIWANMIGASDNASS